MNRSGSVDGISDKFKQTTINSFFQSRSGYKGPRFVETKNKNKVTRSRLKKSSDTLGDIFGASMNVTCSLFEKKVLPIPILSDDEDEDEENIDTETTTVEVSKQKTVVMMSLNKPRKSLLEDNNNNKDESQSLTNNLTFKPSLCSTPAERAEPEPDPAQPSGSNRKRVVGDTTSCASPVKIRVLSQQILSTPEKNDLRVSFNTKNTPVNFNTNSPSTSQTPRTPTKRSLTFKTKRYWASPNKRSPTSPTKRSPTKSTNIKQEDSKMNLKSVKLFNGLLAKLLNSPNAKQLLTPTDWALIGKYTNLGEDSNMNSIYQYFILKLFLWRPTWYNVYKYCGQIHLQMNSSEVFKLYDLTRKSGIVDTDYTTEELPILLNLLDRNSLIDIARLSKISLPNKRGGDIIARLIKNCETQSTLTPSKSLIETLKDQIKKKMGHCVKLSHKFRRAFYKMYLLNSFTNSDLSLPQEYFKSIALNQCRPSYKVDDDYVVFYTPQEFDDYATAMTCYNEYLQAVDKLAGKKVKNWADVFSKANFAYRELQTLGAQKSDSEKERLPYHEKFNAKATYIFIINSCIKNLPNKQYHVYQREWLEYLLDSDFCAHRRGFWYSQLALLKSQYFKDHEGAIRTIIEALREEGDSFSELELHELAQRGKTLNKKSYNIDQLLHDDLIALVPELKSDFEENVIEHRAIRDNDPGKKRIYINKTNDGTEYLSVEEVVIQHYRERNYPKGEHFESVLILTYFATLFWDIIYDHYVPGAFISDVQNIPLDLNTKWFYLNRKEAIDERLKQIESDWSDEDLNEKILTTLERHSNEKGPLQMGFLKGTNVLEMLPCVGRAVLSKILERLVHNYADNHAGFPDLFLYNPETNMSKFVEVKGEHDTLSIKQKLWLQYLVEIGANAEVCYVETTGSKKKVNRV